MLWSIAFRNIDWISYSHSSLLVYLTLQNPNYNHHLALILPVTLICLKPSVETLLWSMVAVVQNKVSKAWGCVHWNCKEKKLHFYLISRFQRSTTVTLVAKNEQPGSSQLQSLKNFCVVLPDSWPLLSRPREAWHSLRHSWPNIADLLGAFKFGAWVIMMDHQVSSLDNSEFADTAVLRLLWWWIFHWQPIWSLWTNSWQPCLKYPHNVHETDTQMLSSKC